MPVQAQDVFFATNGGLDILLMVYPHISQYVGTTKKFKLREDDKTASASLKKLADGNWVVTDFGEVPQVSRNGVQAYAHETGLSWVDALNEIAKKLNIESGKVQTPTIKPKVETRDAGPDEAEGFGALVLDTTWTDFQIETILSKNVLKFLGWKKGEQAKQEAYNKIAAAFKKYHFHPVQSYTWVKDRKHLTFSSTDEYPMFLIDEGDFKKLYQPFHHDKGRRFMYIGGDKKPKDFIHGMLQAKADYDRKKAEIEEDWGDYEKLDEEEKKTALAAFKKNGKFFLCSGGSDALNLAVLGYWVGWMNSETAKLQAWDVAELEKNFETIYQLQDIDATGKQAAHELAMEYLDIFTIELPDELRERMDRRFSPCKDLRDYFNHYTVYDFNKLVDIALPYRFWEKTPEYMGRGSERVRIGWKYDLDNVQAYNFLQKNGFHRISVEGDKEEYRYIRITGNIVKETTAVEIKTFMNEFLIERKMEKDLRNRIYNSTRLNESSLSNLKLIDVDFTNHNADKQLFFFKNCTWEIHRNGIESHRPGKISNYVWETNVLDHHAKILDPSFVITRDEAGVYSIDIKDQSCLFLQFLIQTSRVHWRAEFEDNLKGFSEEEAEQYRKDNHVNLKGPNLTIEQQKEQEQHLINKIFCIGHMLHQYKDPSEPMAIIGMDNKINDDGGSHGRSGKSLILQVACQKILRRVFDIPGTSPKITENPHIFGGLTKHHQMIYIDDMDKYMKFRFFFSAISSDLTCNPKNNDSYTIPFADVPKLGITTNFTLLDQSPSTRGRINIYACGDWYHEKDEYGEYQETRKPKDDLGKALFEEFDRDDWNRFYNTMAQCVIFRMNTKEKILPPMDNVSKRNMQTTMGPNFEAWANVYFSEGSDHLDCLVMKEEAFAEFERKNKALNWSMNKFTTAMKAFCHYHGYHFNPDEVKNTKEGRIIHRVEEKEWRNNSWVSTGKMGSKEFMYILTDINKPINAAVPGKESEIPL